MAPHDLLHDALNRAASKSRNPADPALSPTLRDLHIFSDDDAEIEVSTPLPSYPSSVASSPASSRSTSPTRAGNKRKGGAGKPRRDKAKEREKAEAMKNPLDPFLRFPGEVLGRVLGDLGAEDLLRLGLVCKRWRRSQTLNYTWYLLLQSLTYVSPEERKQRYAETKGIPTWRPSEAKEDWAARFATIFRRDDLAEKEPQDRDENGLTMQEERELKWAHEEEEGQMSKNEMREFYKGLRNKKVKGKYFGKGAARTHEGDFVHGDIAAEG
ncbi:hypothetical protein JCM8547_005932 [Rhodosporidiobolus lusitaniae]